MNDATQMQQGLAFEMILDTRRKLVEIGAQIVWMSLQPAPNAAELAELATLFDKTEKLVEKFESQVERDRRERLTPV